MQMSMGADVTPDTHPLSCTFRGVFAPTLEEAMAKLCEGIRGQQGLPPDAGQTAPDE